MSKRIICLCIIVFILSLMLFGCENNNENSDKSVIENGTFNVGVLLSQNQSSAKYIENGIDFAYSLADSVNLSEKIDVKYSVAYYNDSNEVKSSAEALVAGGVSAIIFDGADYESYTVFSDYIKETDISVVSLSTYSTQNDNIYTISLSPKYMSSCAATYAMEKGYNTCAMLVESSDKYYTDFAETYKNTLKSYVGVEPTVYYKNGELSNYSSSALSSGNYEYLFLVSSESYREELVSELRASGFSGEIMFNEIMDKTSVKNSTFNNCSFLSKLEPDSSNNVSTVFYSMYAEQTGLSEAEISPAVAYGYDAYMTVFEALKSFAPKSSSSFFANTDTTLASEQAEIKMSDFNKAIANVVYLGVTDTVAFESNVATPTYIYVNNINNAEIIFGSKYTFAANNTAAE